MSKKEPPMRHFYVDPDLTWTWPVGTPVTTDEKPAPALVVTEVDHENGIITVSGVED